MSSGESIPVSKRKESASAFSSLSAAQLCASFKPALSAAVRNDHSASASVDNKAGPPPQVCTVREARESAKLKRHILCRCATIGSPRSVLSRWQLTPLADGPYVRLHFVLVGYGMTQHFVYFIRLRPVFLLFKSHHEVWKSSFEAFSLISMCGGSAESAFKRQWWRYFSHPATWTSKSCFH